MAISKEKVLAMSYDEIVAAVKSPATSADMQNLLRDREVAAYTSQKLIEKQNALEAKAAEVTQGLSEIPPTPPSTEALAAEAQAMVAEVPPAPAPTPAPAPVVVDTAAEDAALKAVGAVATRDVSGKITQVVIEYQVADEEGRPIGRPTRLWAPTLIELLGKERLAHESATRAFHRLKQQKLSFEKREQDRALTVEEMKAIAAKALETKDVSEAEKVVRNLISTEFAKKEEELRKKSEYQNGVAIGQQFLREHIEDFYVCEANQKVLSDYLKEHRLDFTLDNLEAAFLDLKDQGALVERPGKVVSTTKPGETTNTSSTPTEVTPVPASATPAPAVNPAPPAATTPQSAAASVTTSTAQAPVNQPANEATVTTPGTANTPHVPRRPVVSGIQPGTLSAQRPGTPDPALARKEFMKQIRDMDPKVMAQRLKTDPQFVKTCEAYGIRTR